MCGERIPELGDGGQKSQEKFPVRLAKSRRHWNFGRLIVQKVDTGIIEQTGAEKNWR